MTQIQKGCKSRGYTWGHSSNIENSNVKNLKGITSYQEFHAMTNIRKRRMSEGLQPMGAPSYPQAGRTTRQFSAAIIPYSLLIFYVILLLSDTRVVNPGDGIRVVFPKFFIGLLCCCGKIPSFFGFYLIFI